jgi:hypothetical protein
MAVEGREAAGCRTTTTLSLDHLLSLVTNVPLSSDASAPANRGTYGQSRSHPACKAARRWSLDDKPSSCPPVGTCGRLAPDDDRPPPTTLLDTTFNRRQRTRDSGRSAG